MYWPTRFRSPVSIVRLLVIITLLVFSGAFNALLFTMLQGRASKTAPHVPKSYLQSARELTIQLLDTSYVAYAGNAHALISGGEMTPELIRSLQGRGLLPLSESELVATTQTLTDQKFVSSVRIDSSEVSGRPTAAGFLPVDTKGVIATHSAGGAAERPFHLRFLFGLLADATHKRSTAMKPIATDIQELNP